MSWKEFKFGDFAEIQPRIALEKGSPYPFIEMSDVKPHNKFVEPSDVRIWKGGGGARFENGDTIFARITPCLEHGKTAKINGLKENSGFGSTELFVFRAREGISVSDFIYYLSCSPAIREPAIKSMIGASGRQRAQKTVVENTVVQVPDVEEQTRIASILSVYDDLIENNRRRIQLLEQAARLLYKEWFVHFRFPGREHTKITDGVPEGWERKHLSELVTTQYGFTETASSEPIGPKFLRGTDINKTSYINWSTVPYCSEENLDFNKYALKIGDIVVVRMADPGKSAIVETEEKAVFASYLVRLTLKPEVDIPTLYLFYVLDDGAYRDFIFGASGGATRKSANAKLLIDFNILIPSSELMTSFFEKVYPLRQQIQKLTRLNSKLSQSRDLLLPRLINEDFVCREHMPKRLNDD